MNNQYSINFRSTELDHVELFELISLNAQTKLRDMSEDQSTNFFRVPRKLRAFLHFQEEHSDKSISIHSFSDSDSKDSTNNSTNGKKKKCKNGNKMLR